MRQATSIKNMGQEMKKGQQDWTGRDRTADRSEDKTGTGGRRHVTRDTEHGTRDIEHGTDDRECQRTGDNGQRTRDRNRGHRDR